MYPYKIRCHEILKFSNAKSVSIGSRLTVLACRFHIWESDRLAGIPNMPRWWKENVTGSQNEPPSETGGEMVDPTTLLLARPSPYTPCMGPDSEEQEAQSVSRERRRGAYRYDQYQHVWKGLLDCCLKYPGTQLTGYSYEEHCCDRRFRFQRCREPTTWLTTYELASCLSF